MHLWQNKIQAKNVDLIICSSNKYSSYYKGINCNHVLEIPHGVSDDEFKLNSTKVNAIKNQYGKFVILIGTIASNVAIKLLKEIALKKINLLIIGSETIRNEEWAALKELDHIHYLGILNAKELNNYIAASQAGLISYQFIPKINQVARTPLKALNYLAQYKPIITSIDAEIEELKNHGIYRAKNVKEYVSLVDEAINSTLDLNIEKVNQYLENHKYPILINTILNQFDKS
ncbi:MAG: hypothetical protein JKX68_01345 [Flavobacteriales bacterium]|nr:hypothetical protein [Flavobacteriales bacterium]